MKKATHYGVLIYSKYEDNVILSTLNVEELKNILATDRDLMRFEIISFTDKEDRQLFTYSHDTERIEDRLGSTYNAFADKPYTYKTKVSWRNESGNWLTKKKAEEERVKYNKRMFTYLDRHLAKVAPKEATQATI